SKMPSISEALTGLRNKDFRKAALEFFATLGYRSKRTLAIDSLAELRESLDPNNFLNESNASLSVWQSVSFLFQLTPTELSADGQGLNLELEEAFDPKAIKSYVFFAVDLTPGNAAPNRSLLS